MYYYQPNALMLTSYREDQESRLTFSLVDCSHGHFLFPKTKGQNLTELALAPGAVFIPSVVKPMLTAMAKPDYIKDVGAELERLRRENGRNSKSD